MKLHRYFLFNVCHVLTVKIKMNIGFKVEVTPTLFRGNAIT